MRGQNKYILIILFLIVCLTFTLDLLLERFLIYKTIKQNQLIVENSAMHIAEVDKIMAQNLKSSVIAFSEKMAIKKKMTMQDLISMRNDLGLSGMNITNKNGGLELDSDGTHLPGGRLYEKYNKNVFSIFQDDECPEYRSIVKNIPVVTPIYKSNLSQAPVKFAVLYSDYGYLFVEYNRTKIEDILKRNVELNGDLIYLGLSGPKEEIAFYVKNNKNIKPFFRNKETYDNSLHTENLKSKIIIYTSFGQKYPECCTLQTKGRASNRGQYFYILTAEFSKQNLNKQILFIRMVFSIITTLILAVVYFVRKSIQQKSSLNLALKSQAHQIHHDIASPLQALDWGINRMTRDQKAMEGKDAIDIKYSIETIKDIISDLYYIHDDEAEKELKISTELVYPIIYSSFSSARLLLDSNVKTKLSIEKTKDFNLLIDTDRIELRRTLLNLIKNALESKGNVTISLKQINNNAVIIIKDNGCGIDENTLKQLMSGKSITQGKTTGRGLGFPYSKQIIEKLQGTITLKSELNKGTEQIITLPLSINKPSWFVDKINLKQIKTIVILDDFELIHTIWKDKLKEKTDIKLISFFNVKEFEEYLKEQKSTKQTFFFIDYSLETLLKNGIDLIEKHNLQNNSILVTSKYLELSIKEIALQKNIKILPKEFIEMIEI